MFAHLSAVLPVFCVFYVCCCECVNTSAASCSGLDFELCRVGLFDQSLLN